MTLEEKELLIASGPRLWVELLETRRRYRDEQLADVADSWARWKIQIEFEASLNPMLYSIDHTRALPEGRDNSFAELLDRPTPRFPPKV